MQYIENSKGYSVSKEGKTYRYGKEVFHETAYGYYGCRVYFLDDTNKLQGVHRWVAEAFIPNPENKPFVNHKDGNKKNNHFTNLEWVTNQENVTHAVETGLVLRGEDTWNGISEQDAIRICELLSEGVRLCDIARETGTNYSVVKHIYNKNSWGHISDNYTFKTERKKCISTETAIWICKQLEAGVSIKEILSIAKNPLVNRNVVSNIKYGKSHTHISKDFKI